MIKSIFKEGFIVILLLIAVALILGIIFYEYIPSNKTVPIKMEEYALSEDIKEELKQTVADEQEQNIVKTFFIDSSDLDLYESTNDYDKGKANPFASYSVEADSNTDNTTNSTDNTIDTSEDETEENKNEVYINKPGKNY